MIYVSVGLLQADIGMAASWDGVGVFMYANALIEVVAVLCAFRTEHGG